MLLIAGSLVADEIHQKQDDESRTNSLVKDGTFQVEQKQNMFGNWLVNFRILDQNPGIVSLDSTVFLKDGKSLKINNPKGPNAGALQTIKGIKPGSRYRISFYLKYQDIKPDDPNSFGGAVVNVWHDGNRWFPGKALTGSSDWKRYEFIYNTPAASPDNLNVSLMIINAKGTAWFDDIQLVEVK